MVNFKERVLCYPEYSKQFSCGESLITIFNCPPEARLMKTKFAGLWSHENYIFYVLEGKKVWHTAHGSYEISEGSCVLVRKGACILEQFFDIGFCLVLFFIPDQFICDTLKSRSVPIAKTGRQYEPVISIRSTETLKSFFISMYAYFSGTTAPDRSLLELKFRELILNIAENRDNVEALSYFCSLMNEPQSVALERIMQDNYCFNLKLEQYAALCNRSLSAFKRDFQKQFNSTPGKWLLEKRLQQSLALLSNNGKSVSEAAFETGFENISHFSRCFKQRFGFSPQVAKNTAAS
ncbi:Helix-turn-helix domain-containing protein [Flavisolibacter ginsengisoli DSM 18119]|uniref:Helix-turn-helix domain-containing protein n=2 Tax=Flavisolibacter TaxID=398041 RepID=A0A1M5GLL7_9BACT|nr:Helix-turn-helix domain-containing protein [Flavisolibacter ginsengisoli DSM 18119]